MSTLVPTRCWCRGSEVFTSACSGLKWVRGPESGLGVCPAGSSTGVWPELPGAGRTPAPHPGLPPVCEKSVPAALRGAGSGPCLAQQQCPRLPVGELLPGPGSRRWPAPECSPVEAGALWTEAQGHALERASVVLWVGPRGTCPEQHKQGADTAASRGSEACAVGSCLRYKALQGALPQKEQAPQRDGWSQARWEMLKGGLLEMAEVGRQTGTRATMNLGVPGGQDALCS